MKTEEILCESAYLSLRPAPKIVFKTAWQFDMKIIGTQMKETWTSSTEKPAAELIFGKIDVKSMSKQVKENSLSSTGRARETRSRIETETHLWETRREEHQETDEDKTDGEYGETQTGQEEDQHSKVDFRIQGKPNAAVQQEDDVRRQLISNLVYQMQNHRNKDALIADFASRISLTIRSAKSRGK